MMKKTFVTGATLAFAVAAPAFADTTMVTCQGYVISMSDTVAIQGQAEAGTVAGFEKLVCERSSAAADLSGDAKVIPVFIEELGIATRVVIFPLDRD